jgi:hypothetical protein
LGILRRLLVRTKDLADSYELDLDEAVTFRTLHAAATLILGSTIEEIEAAMMNSDPELKPLVLGDICANCGAPVGESGFFEKAKP